MVLNLKILTVFLLFIFNSSLFSQEKTQDSIQYNTEEINVTSTKTEVTLQQTPS